MFHNKKYCYNKVSFTDYQKLMVGNHALMDISFSLEKIVKRRTSHSVSINVEYLTFSWHHKEISETWQNAAAFFGMPLNQNDW